MQIFFFVAAAVFGAILGSFINALSFRFNTGKSIVRGRSRCMSCDKTLSARDLVPIFSFIFLRGRCRQCGSKVSWQYPLVECIAALLSLLVYFSYPVFGTNVQPLAYAFWLLVWMVLLFVVVYDIKHNIIPWSCSGFLALLALISLFFSFGAGVQFMMPSVSVLLSGPLLASPLVCLSLISWGRWMGWGDGALELSIGWLLGLYAGLTALTLAFWSGAFVGLAMLLYQRLSWQSGRSHLTMRSEIPFAPFLVLGAALAYFFHVDFFQQISVLF